MASVGLVARKGGANESNEKFELHVCLEYWVCLTRNEEDGQIIAIFIRQRGAGQVFGDQALG
jgi:hypothetical protein